MRVGIELTELCSCEQELAQSSIHFTDVYVNIMKKCLSNRLKMVLILVYQVSCNSECMPIVYRSFLMEENKVVSMPWWRIFYTAFSLWKHMKCFPHKLRERNLKTPFSKHFVVHAKTQIPPVCRVVSKCSLFLTDAKDCGWQTVEFKLRFESYWEWCGREQ